MPLKYWQGWGIDHLSRKPVPVLDYPLGKEMLPNVQSETPLSDAALHCCHASSHWRTGRRVQQLSLHFRSSGSCREQWGCPSSKEHFIILILCHYFLQSNYCISYVHVCNNSCPIQIGNIYWNSCVFIDVMPNEIIALSSFS